MSPRIAPPQRLTVCHPDAQAQHRWVHALRARLPQLRIAPYPDPADADAALVWHPPPEFFARLPSLRVLFAAGAGVDALLAHPGLPPALPVVRLEDAGMAAQMIEYCVHEVVRRYRGFDRYEAQQRAGRWAEIEPPPRARYTVGVLGMGVLGRRVAQALAQLGYGVIGHGRSAGGPETGHIERSHGDAQLPAFLARCDVLVLLAPLTAATRDLMNAERLAMLPAHAWLVNVARGALVDECALLEAIDAGRLAGATLDVFRDEPLPPSHPFWTHPRIRVTPHVAAMTLVDEGAAQVAAKIGAMRTGALPSGLVDRARGY